MLPNSRRTVSPHCATLGMGLLPNYRGQGIGRKLMQRVRSMHLSPSFTRIELTVRETNVSAVIALYQELPASETEGLAPESCCLQSRGVREHSLMAFTPVTA